MKQEEKSLLLQDLCGRLPYGVKGLAYVYGEPCNINTNINGVINKCIVTDYESYMLELIKLSSKDITIKPYLRPMSSMTEEERMEYELLANHCIVTSIGFIHLEATTLTDWLNAHHFDFRNLIERGMAIEVTEENNPYKE